DRTTGASASRAGAADRSLSGALASLAAPAVVGCPTSSAFSPAAEASPAGVAGFFAAGRFAAGFLATGLAVADLAVVDLAVVDLAVVDLAVVDLAVVDLAVADFVVAGFAVADFAVVDVAVVGVTVVDFAVPAGFFAAGVRGVEDVDAALFARGARGARGFGVGAADPSVFSAPSPAVAAAAVPEARRGARGVVVRGAEGRGARGVRGFAGADAAGSTLSEPASVGEEDGSGDSGSGAVIAPNYQRPPTVPAGGSRGTAIRRHHESTTTGANHATFQGLLATVDRTRRRDIPVNRI
ncbi:hypothetical protein HR12_20600, partial [Microbacterium sp. SUBG005]